MWKANIFSLYDGGFYWISFCFQTGASISYCIYQLAFAFVLVTFHHWMSFLMFLCSGWITSYCWWQVTNCFNKRKIETCRKCMESKIDDIKEPLKIWYIYDIIFRFVFKLFVLYLIVGNNTRFDKHNVSSDIRNLFKSNYNHPVQMMTQWLWQFCDLNETVWQRYFEHMKRCKWWR